MNLHYDMSVVECVPGWVLHMLTTASSDEMVKICIVLWGIRFWRNKEIWENKSVTPNMEGSFRMIDEWKKAKGTQQLRVQCSNRTSQKFACTWSPPAEGILKTNVDASVVPDSDTFSIGMIIRDCHGDFLAG